MRTAFDWTQGNNRYLPQVGPFGSVEHGDLTELRSLLRKTQDVRLYLPTPGAEHAWQAAGERLALR